MSVKGFTFLFLIIFLTFSPVTAGIDILHSYVEFPEFYEVNVSDNRAKIIGMVGVPYRGNVTLDSPYVVVDPTGAHLEMDIIYTNIKESDVLNISNYSTNKPIFWYKSSNREGHFYQFFQLNDTFDLSEKFDVKIEKGENKSFEFFNIVFLEPGMYAVSWKLSEDERFKTMFVSIATPLEYEQLTKQAEVLEAEKGSAEASESTSKWTKWLAIVAAVSASVTAILAGFTFWMARVSRQNVDVSRQMVAVSRRTLNQMQKELIYDVLAKLLMEYRTPRMFSAVNRLWQFHKKCEKAKKELVDEYEKIYNSEKEKIDSMDNQKQLEALKTTLNNQRRLVSQFYGLLAALWANGILPENIIFENWNREALEIIPSILIPMGNKLREMNSLPIDENTNLRKLYDASRAYNASKDG